MPHKNKEVSRRYHREYMRNWCPENREKIHSYSRKHYQKNKKEESERHRIYVHTPRGRYAVAKSEARRRRYMKVFGESWKLWGLTFEEWWSLVEGDECIYCSGPLTKDGVGLDRIDSSLGYVVGNVVPCCRWNNFERGGLSFDEYWLVIADRWRRLNDWTY